MQTSGACSLRALVVAGHRTEHEIKVSGHPDATHVVIDLRQDHLRRPLTDLRERRQQSQFRLQGLQCVSQGKIHPLDHLLDRRAQTQMQPQQRAMVGAHAPLKCAFRPP